MVEKRHPCTTAEGRGKLSFPTHATAKAARSIGRQFDGKSKKVYRCSAAVGVAHYHLATR